MLEIHLPLHGSRVPFLTPGFPPLGRPRPCDLHPLPSSHSPNCRRRQRMATHSSLSPHSAASLFALLNAVAEQLLPGTAVVPGHNLPPGLLLPPAPPTTSSVPPAMDIDDSPPPHPSSPAAAVIHPPNLGDPASSPLSGDLPGSLVPSPCPDLPHISRVLRPAEAAESGRAPLSHPTPLPPFLDHRDAETASPHFLVGPIRLRRC